VPVTLEEIRALAGLLRARAEGAPQDGARPELAPWARVLAGLGRGAEVREVLRDVAFRPCLLVDGLRHAAVLEEAGLRFTCAALAQGLEAFAGFFVARERVEAAPEERGVLAAEQHRYFAWLLAQLPECDVDLGAVFAIMQGDAMDSDSARQVRQIHDIGPAALLGTELFDAEEKQAFLRLFEEGPAAWEPLRELLVRRWSLPVLLAPSPRPPPGERN